MYSFSDVLNQKFKGLLVFIPYLNIYYHHVTIANEIKYHILQKFKLFQKKMKVAPQ